MSDENDTQEDNFIPDATPDEALEPEPFTESDEHVSEEVTPKKKSALGLKFLTFLMLVMAVGLFVFPFVWGLEDTKKISPDSSVLNDWLWWLGDMHVLILHIPIGVFIWVLTVESIGLLTFRKFKPHLGGTLFFASITSVIAVVLGYFYFLRGDYGPAKLEWDLEGNKIGMHMWLSILFAFFVILSFIAKMWSRHNDKGSPFYPFFLILAAASMTLGAHMGGTMVHDSDIEGDFMKLIAGEPLGVAAEDIVQMPVVTDIPAQERLVYSQIVEPILHGKCWECHADAELNPLGKKKIKGRLVMTSVADLLAGGKGGEDFPTLIPGDSENSEMMVRVNLDIDDDEFMPTGKEDEPHMHLTDGEKRILNWWIDNTPLIDEAGDKPLSEVEGYDAILADVEAFESVREAGPAVKVDQEKVAAEKAKIEEAKTSRREMIQKGKAMVEKELPGALTFSSKDSEQLYFTSVSQGKEFDDEGLAKLAPVVEEIIDLDVKKTMVSDKGMETIVKMINLDKLMLNETKITDMGLKTISDLPNLRSLSLFGTEVTDKGIAELAKMSSLKNVYLTNTKVTQGGVDELKSRLPQAMIEFSVPSPPKPKKMAEKPKAAKENEAKKVAQAKNVAKPKAKKVKNNAKVAPQPAPVPPVVPNKVSPTEKNALGAAESEKKKTPQPNKANKPKTEVKPAAPVEKKVAPVKEVKPQAKPAVAPSPNEQPKPAEKVAKPKAKPTPKPAPVPNQEKVEPKPIEQAPKPANKPVEKKEVAPRSKPAAPKPVEKKQPAPAPKPVAPAPASKPEKKPVPQPAPTPKPAPKPTPKPAPVKEKVQEAVEEVAPIEVPTKEVIKELIEEPAIEQTAEEKARAAIERLRKAASSE